MTKGWKVYWIVVAATVANYLIMVLWSLPLVSEMAGGNVPFDMRPSGYTFQEAQEFLNTIDGKGRDFYLNTQQLLDSFYPALLATTLAIPLVHLTPRYWGWVLAVIAVAAGVFDYLENGAVASMLTLNPDELTKSIVSTANHWTLAKSVTTTIASVALLAVLVRKGLIWLKSRKPERG